MHNAFVTQFLAVVANTAKECHSPDQCEALWMVLDKMADTPSFRGVDDNRLAQVREVVAERRQKLLGSHTARRILDLA